MAVGVILSCSWHGHFSERPPIQPSMALKDARCCIQANFTTHEIQHNLCRVQGNPPDLPSASSADVLFMGVVDFRGVTVNRVTERFMSPLLLSEIAHFHSVILSTKMASS